MTTKTANKYLEIKFIFGLLPLFILGILFGIGATVHATDYSYVEGTQTINLSPGMYTVETWGSKGPDGNNYGGDGPGPGGLGGYAKGTIILSNSTSVYIIGSSGTETVRLGANTSANNLVVGTAGGPGGDGGYDDTDIPYLSWAGEPGTPGVGSGYPPAVNISTTSGARNGVGLVTITAVPSVISVSSPTTNQVYSAQTSFNIITVSGKAASANGDSLTISATINGKAKSVTVNNAPTTLPGSDNFTLTWDVAADNITEGSYSNVLISAQNTTAETLSITLGPTLIVDRTAPTVNSLSTLATQATAVAVKANSTDPRTPMQYLFNIGGVDVGTWQSADTYAFGGLIPNTTYTFKYKVKDSLGNISGYSTVSNITTLATDPTTYAYYSGTKAIALDSGVYTIEAWGAKGSDGYGPGDTNGGLGGYGGYAKGTLTVSSPAIIYIIGSSGTETLQLNLNNPANNLLIGGGGGNGQDGYDDGADVFYDGAPGAPGVGTTYSPLTNTTTTTGTNSGAASVKIVMIGQVNHNPAISISTPTTNQIYSAQNGYKAVTITGKVSDPDGNNVTVSATINGKTKSATVNNAPTTPPGSPNFTLTWDIASDSIAEGVYSSVSLTANDGVGGTASAALTPSLTVDLTVPAVNAPTSGSVSSTSFTGISNASDTSTPMQYLFNLNGVDQGTWQSGGTYNFTGLTANTTYTIRYKAQDSIGNTSGYSGVLSVTTLATPPASPIAITTMTGALVDITNNGDGRDLRVMFKGAPDESKIVEYRIYAVKTSNTVGFDETAAAALPNTQYMREPVKGKLRLHLTPLPQALRDSDGLIIKDGINYTVFVLSYAKTGNPHKLTSLGTITLDGNVPLNKLQAPIISDTANYGDGRDIMVTFRKPANEADIKEYWIFVQNVSDTGVFGEPQATLNARHYVVSLSSAGKTSYSVKLIQGFTDIAGSPIANNQQYKVYILIVMNKASTSNILSLPSKPLKLLATVPSALPVRNLTAAKIAGGHAGSNISVTFNEPLAVTNIQEYRIFISTGTGSLDAATAAGLDNTRYIKLDSTAKGAVHTVSLTGLNNIYDGTALITGDYKVYVLTVGKTNTYANRLAGPSRLVKLD